MSFYRDEQLCGILDWITVPSLPELPQAGQQCILSVCLVLSYSLGLHTSVKGIPEIEIDTNIQ